MVERTRAEAATVPDVRNELRQQGTSARDRATLAKQREGEEPSERTGL